MTVYMLGNYYYCSVGTFMFSTDPNFDEKIFRSYIKGGRKIEYNDLEGSEKSSILWAYAVANRV